jgi:hypothetical protein
MGVVPAILDLEASRGECRSTFGCHRRQRSDIAPRPEPEHARRAARWKRTQPIQGDIKCGGASRDRSHGLESFRDTLLIDQPEEVHREVERLRACPSDPGNALAQILLQPTRHGQPRLSERDREKAPHPAGFAVVVGFGLAAAGEGLGLGALHGFPPALEMLTVI